MTGVDIIGELLMAAPLVTARVPAEQMKAGALAENAPLPALLVRSVSCIERQKLKRVGLVRMVERVSVAVRAANYADQTDIMKLLPSACAGKLGTIAGVTNVSVLSGGMGPDVRGPGNTFEQTIDFWVSFETAA